MSKEIIKTNDGFRCFLEFPNRQDNVRFQYSSELKRLKENGAIIGQADMRNTLSIRFDSEYFKYFNPTIGELAKGMEK